MPMEFLTDAQVARVWAFRRGAVAGGSGTILLPRRVSTADQNPQLQLDALATGRY